MTGELRSASCLAATDVLAYELGHGAVQDLLTARPAIADQLAVLLAARQEGLARKGGEISALAASRSSQRGHDLREKLRRFFNLV